MNALEKRPEIRARHILSKLKALESLDASVMKRVLDRFPKDALETIQTAEEDQWLPLEYNIDLSENVAAEVGETGIYQWGMKSFEYSINSSMISPFIRAALDMLKIGPKPLLRFAPRFWKSVYRNCGEMSVVEERPGCVRISLNDLPPIMVKSRILIITIAAFIQALGNFRGIQGQTVIEKISQETRSAVIVVSWNP